MIIDVAVPYRVASSFHYTAEPEIAQAISLGSVVQVPLGKRHTHGFVLGILDSTTVDPAKLKPIGEIIVAEPIFDENMLKFLRWVSEYYCHPLGEVISAAIPRQYCQIRKTKRVNKKKNTTLEFLQSDQAVAPKPILNPDQAKAVSIILAPEEKRPFLIEGVTGSGKTEVYMSVLEDIVAQGKGGIVLVPEIALTPQLLSRFSGRFPGLVAVLHSDLTPGERFTQWERLRLGQARIVVGARSAVFAPVKNLGLIVVDEEQEGSFKQEDSLRYHARDIAVVRGAFCGAKVILGSATPSLESYSNALTGKYVSVSLPKRVEDRPMPVTHFVDIKDQAQWYSAKLPWLSRFLASKMERVLASGQQTMLYLNRLGFAHFLFCQDCGHTWRCKNCDVALTYYRHPPLLKCHYCGVERIPPQNCESCQGSSLDSIGLGTEQVEKELKRVFPTARIIRMDRSIIKNRKDLEATLNAIAAREVDIVIGTQMMAKGHDFPGIALVGILMADASLNLPDFRAHERTFQIITQVSGRAGRADVPGEVVIQTVNPEHPVLIYAAQHRSEEFYRMELESRRQFGYPPYQRLAMFRFEHMQLIKVEAFAYDMTQFLKDECTRRGFRCSLFGPAEAPLSRLKNVYRWQCLVKSESVKDLQLLLKRAQEFAVHRKSPVKMAMDVDPINSL